MYKNIYIRICGIKKINSAKFVRLSAAINIKQKLGKKMYCLKCPTHSDPGSTDDSSFCCWDT